MSKVLQGKCAVRGIAVGRVKVLDIDMENYLKNYNRGSVEEEEQKYYSARQEAAESIVSSMESAKKEGAKEQAEIMEAHQAIIYDPMLEDKILERIRESAPAPLAVLKASEEISEMISSLEDPYLRERAADIKDVGKKIAGILLGIKPPDFSEGNIIICGEEIEPSVVAGIPEGKVTGIIIGGGSFTSHSVIIAGAKGIPTVVGIGSDVRMLNEGAEVILDGEEGKIIVDPEEELIGKYKLKIEEEMSRLEYYLSLSQVPAVTRDGTRIILAANIGNPKDIDSALKYGCEGVGLFRTEFAFTGREDFPSEDEQFEAYKYVVEKCGENLCIIRTMDIGGDKPLKYLKIDREENPFLGWRAIRICLDRTDIFITQVKAILRSGVYGKAALMLPMVISTEEIRKARKLIQQAMSELEAEGKEYDKNIPVGIMVETPAAAVMADALAKECSFFSIGTNDLVQYTLAVDRGNPKVSNLYNHFNPAVLRLINRVIKAAHSNGLWVGMCGEMAGDPLASRLLAAMGIDELSMNGPSIPKVKEVLIGTEIKKDMADKILEMNDTAEVIEYLKSV